MCFLYSDNCKKEMYKNRAMSSSVQKWPSICDSGVTSPGPLTAAKKEMRHLHVVPQTFGHQYKLLRLVLQFIQSSHVKETKLQYQAHPHIWNKNGGSPRVRLSLIYTLLLSLGHQCKFLKNPFKAMVYLPLWK